MALIKTREEIDILREGGRRLSEVLQRVAECAKNPGTTGRELDELAEKLIRKSGDEPAFLGYTPHGADRPFPATLCVSVNDEIVHGIPNEQEKVLEEGDIVGLDLGLRHQGLFVDSAVTVGVGQIDEAAERLIVTTSEALSIAIAACKVSAFINDIGCAIEKFVKPYQYGIVRDLGGHGVGHAVHEKPYIQNYCIKGKSLELKEGMVLALEPMLNEGTYEVVLGEDGYTYHTADGSRSAHFEHTIVITVNGPEILTV